MSLIKCPECNKEISDKAEFCIHCGYPILKLINNNKTSKFYKMIIINLYDNKPKAIMIIRDILNVNIKEAKKILDRPIPNTIICGLNHEDAILLKQKFNNYDIEVTIEEDNESLTKTTINIDVNGNIKTQNYNMPKQVYSKTCNELPKCPYCNSTNIKKLSFTKKTISIGGLGILSNKIGKQWHCSNCDSDF